VDELREALKELVVEIQKGQKKRCIATMAAHVMAGMVVHGVDHNAVPEHAVDIALELYAETTRRLAAMGE